MKTAVSIPDEVFEQADQLARRMKTSRSALYALALSEYIARHDTDRVTELMDEVLEEAGAADATFAAAAAHRILQETDW
jgi:predicted transcriptional regulator